LLVVIRPLQNRKTRYLNQMEKGYAGSSISGATLWKYGYNGHCLP